MKPQLSQKSIDFQKSPSPVREIMSFANPATFARYGWKPQDIISFAGGWVNHQAPEELRQSYQEIIADEQAFHASGAYPPTIGSTETRQAIVDFERHLYGIHDLKVENIAIGNNSTQMTYNLFTALCDPGDKIMLLDPSYCNIPAQITTALDVKIIRFSVLDKETWEYNADRKIAELKDFILREKPKMILLISPDNPTSQVLSDEFVEAALESAQKIGAFLIIDMAYKEIVWNMNYPKYFSWAPSDNFITLHSNSKWCRGLGRRLGWIQAPEFVIQAMESIQGSSMLCPDMLHGMSFTRYVKKALTADSIKPYITDMADRYEKAANFTYNAINEHLGLPVLKPQGGLYTVIDAGVDGAYFTEQMIKEQGVLLVPGWGFGRSLQNAVRICYGPLVNNLDLIEQGIRKLGIALAKIKGKEHRALNTTSPASKKTRAKKIQTVSAL